MTRSRVNGDTALEFQTLQPSCRPLPGMVSHVYHLLYTIHTELLVGSMPACMQLWLGHLK